MKYTIKAFYQTGDSFSHYDTETVLPMSWENLDNAKAALKRLEEHYRWYDNENNSHYSFKQKKLKKPEWHTSGYDFVTTVILDNGNKVDFSAPWCGHFEKLYSLEIILDPSDMRVDFI